MDRCADSTQNFSKPQMQTFDLCLAWSWEYDADLVALLRSACQRHKLSLCEVTPKTLAETLDRIGTGTLKIHAFFDRASDADPSFLPLVEWAARHVPCRVNPFAAARRA